MNVLPLLLPLTIGLALGAVAVWLLLRTKIAAAVSTARADFQAQVATLTERVSAKDQQLTTLQSALQAEEDQKTQLAVQLQQESNARATAEEKANRIPQLEAELKARDEQAARLQTEVTGLTALRAELLTSLQKERKAYEEKLAVLTEAERKLSDAFNSLAAEALKNNNQSFLALAKENLAGFQQEAKGDLDKRQESIKTLLKPLEEQLKTYQHRLQQSESVQSASLGEVKKQLETLAQHSQSLAHETQQFRIVLKSNQARGRWGEETLRRVVEAAGMSAHCDFSEQTQAGDAKPDLVVRLPGNRLIIVDAKVPDLDFLTALESADPIQRSESLQAHAAKLKATIKALADRDYPRQFPNALDYVVLFLPAESLFSAALEGDRDLLVWAASKRILLATPASLIALLRSVSVSWQQHAQTENAQKIGEAAQELYARMAKFSEHFKRMRTGLEGANAAFNDAVGNYERMVRPSGERLVRLSGATPGKELLEIQPVESTLRLPANGQG